MTQQCSYIKNLDNLRSMFTSVCTGFDAALAELNDNDDHPHLLIKLLNQTIDFSL